MPRKRTQTASPQPTTTLTPDQIDALRKRAQTDLLFLGREILGYSAMVDRVHGKMCELFLKKDPNVPHEQLDTVKTRLLLAPRGSFKSCTDMADTVQLILNYPNIRILMVSGTQALAERILSEIKQHFQTNEKLRALFPEHCPPPDTQFGTADSFTTPARNRIYREPTVSISTVGSVKAGSHYNHIKIDDMVTELNSLTADQRQKVIDFYDGLIPLLEPDGYIDLIGTRYHQFDLYGKLLERDAAVRRRVERGEAEEDESSDLKTCIMSAWTIKPGREISRDDNGAPILTKDDVELLFAERLKWRFLYKQYRDNPTAFSFQYLNDPTVVSVAERPFTDQLIESHSIPHTQMPHPGACRDFILWDLAGVNIARDTIDYSVGVVGRLDPNGRLFIIDMVRGRWTATQLASQIVTLAKNYPTAPFTWIEDAQGARYLEPTVTGIASLSGISVRIDWVPVPRFGGAKRYRIDALAQYLRADKLWFAGWLPNLDILKSELLDKNPTHDDCSDAIALMVKQLNIAATVQSEAEVPKANRREIANRLFEAAIFGDDDSYTIEETIPEPDQPQTFSAGILGYGFCS